MGQSSPAASGRGDQQVPEFEITEELEAGAPEGEADQEEFELFHDNEEYHHDASDEPQQCLLVATVAYNAGR